MDAEALEDGWCVTLLQVANDMGTRI